MTTDEKGPQQPLCSSMGCGKPAEFAVQVVERALLHALACRDHILWERRPGVIGVDQYLRIIGMDGRAYRA